MLQLMNKNIKNVSKQKRHSPKIEKVEGQPPNKFELASRPEIGNATIIPMGAPKSKQNACYYFLIIKKNFSDGM